MSVGSWEEWMWWLDVPRVMRNWQSGERVCFCQKGVKVGAESDGMDVLVSCSGAETVLNDEPVAIEG